MIWLLPIILIGGLIWPVIGYLVLGMIIFFSALSFFKKRYWCWFLCPRGSFLEIVVPFFSRKNNLPGIFSKKWFRWSVFVLLIGYLISIIIRTGGNWITIGAAFISMCILTTVLGTIVGAIYKPRSWCVICPMGTLQETISRLHSRADKNNNI